MTMSLGRDPDRFRHINSEETCELLCLTFAFHANICHVQTAHHEHCVAHTTYEDHRMWANDRFAHIYKIWRGPGEVLASRGRKIHRAMVQCWHAHARLQRLGRGAGGREGHTLFPSVHNVKPNNNQNSCKNVSCKGTKKGGAEQSHGAAHTTAFSVPPSRYRYTAPP